MPRDPGGYKGDKGEDRRKDGLKGDKDPWGKASSTNPSEKWQPEAWDPSKGSR